ncbi:MAG: hypothetical protein EVB11_09510 [Winogradskyella sp.]|nr:MAG: hypothetical protein EVB11_09510 [Winogradskyella sp.]
MVDFWKEASNLFKHYELTYEEFLFDISTDFSDIFQQAKEHDFFYGGELKLIISSDSKDPDIIRIRNTVAVNFVHILFLCMNLSFPGSLNLLKCRIKNSEQMKEEVSFTSYYFESAWGINDEYEWPSIKKIPLDIVIKWYNSLNINSKMIAETNVEKTLFSILDFCNYDYDDNPTLIVWITNALEAFYGIKSRDSIVHSLKNRMYLHLNNPNQSKRINKKINEFYSYRSAFVHGDMKILRHGSSKYIYNDTIDLYFDELWKLCEFGNALIISSIQKLILLDKKSLSFKEEIEYR